MPVEINPNVLERVLGFLKPKENLIETLGLLPNPGGVRDLLQSTLTTVNDNGSRGWYRGMERALRRPRSDVKEWTDRIVHRGKPYDVGKSGSGRFHVYSPEDESPSAVFNVHRVPWKRGTAIVVQPTVRTDLRGSGLGSAIYRRLLKEHLILSDYGWTSSGMALWDKLSREAYVYKLTGEGLERQIGVTELSLDGDPQFVMSNSPLSQNDKEVISLLKKHRSAPTVQTLQMGGIVGGGLALGEMAQYAYRHHSGGSLHSHSDTVGPDARDLPR